MKEWSVNRPILINASYPTKPRVIYCVRYAVEKRRAAD